MPQAKGFALAFSNESPRYSADFVVQRLVPTFDGRDDFIRIGGPHEGLGVLVSFLQEAVDGGLEIDDRAEGAAFEAAFGQFGEEALDRIEPGGRGIMVRIRMDLPNTSLRREAIGARARDRATRHG